MTARSGGTGHVACDWRTLRVRSSDPAITHLLKAMVLHGGGLARQWLCLPWPGRQDSLRGQLESPAPAGATVTLPLHVYRPVHAVLEKDEPMLANRPVAEMALAGGQLGWAPH